MHFIFVTSLLPEAEPKTGFEIANAAIVAAYRELGVRLTLLGFSRPGVPHRAEDISLGELQIENALAGAATKASWVLKAAAQGLPVAAAKLRVVSEEDLRGRLLGAAPFDGLILNSVQMPAAFPMLLDAGPATFIAHNVEHLSARQNAAAMRGAVSRGLYRREARLLERIEKTICEKARIVHALSDDDLAALCPGGGKKALALPLAIGRPTFPDDRLRAHDVGMIGTWSWAPNRVGLDWFLERVVPLLPPSMSIAIAGVFDGPPPHAPVNVRFLGRVPDAQRFVRSLRVVALATKGGTGVQLKTIEALEEGMPCVATPSALRGVARPLPANVAFADEPEAFAAHLLAAVEAERAGALQRLDGRAFAERQRQGLRAALAEGLRSFTDGGVPAPAGHAPTTRAMAESRS